MNSTHLILSSLVGIVLVASAVHWYKYNTNSTDSFSPPEYVKRLIDWAKKYHAVQSEDITHIEEATSIKSLFISLKKVPTCRSAKLLAHLYFSIYVERDNKALRDFVSLMKEHYPDRYQWDNAFHWKHAEQLLWDTYDTLSSNDSTKDENLSKSRQGIEELSNKTSSQKISNTSIKNFKAIVSKSISKKEI
jgi:hypothetical protein